MAITKANTGALATPTRKVPIVIALPSWPRNWTGWMSRAAAHIRPPPSSARMSAKNASSGRAIISAEHARQDQDLDRVEPEGAQRVDLLVDLHGADLRREGAARAAGDR